MSSRISIGLAWAILLSQQAFGLGSKGLGVGMIVGQPSGIMVVASPHERLLLDVGAAWSWNDWLIILADCKFTDYLTPSSLHLTGYYGLGVYGGSSDAHQGVFGLRVPLGISYRVPYTSLEFFGELVPGLEMFPETRARLQAGLGILLWFSRLF
jgi:hypothetical protein